MKQFLTLLAIHILISCLLFSGCSTTASLYKNLRPSTASQLKKRILLLPLLNQAGLSSSKLREMENKLRTLLEKEGHPTILKEAQIATSMAGASGLSGAEMAIDPIVIREAQSAGADVILSVILHPLEARTRKLGIWPALLTRREVVISVSLSVLDVATKTLLVTSVKSEAIKMEEPEEAFTLFEGDNPEQGTEETLDPFSRVDEKALSKALTRILEDHVSIATERLEDTPWTGRILEVDIESIIINAGKEDGVLPGHIFEVFAKGDMIEAAGGNTYRIMGEKVGEIRIISVGEKRAVASPLKGSAFAADQYIRLKSGK
ncbi:MAG: hypothetical protein JRJ03_13240 [Deltaproteobacteria bacterium]|nr:hypothetical protein [Deltaproteobacteria bacterium]